MELFSTALETALGIGFTVGLLYALIMCFIAFLK